MIAPVSVSAIRILSCLLGLFASLFASGLPAQAGDGTLDKKTGVLNFRVSIEFTPIDEELNIIKARFKQADAIFSDAMDGQLHFGKITLITNGTSSKSDPEIRIYNEAGRSNSPADRYTARGTYAKLYLRKGGHYSWFGR